MRQRNQNKLPGAEEASKVFQSLEQQIGDHVVDASAPGDVALDAADRASRGGQMPKVIKDFIQRTTDPPNLGDLTYSEARQFLSNAGQRLSTAEQMKLTPMATRYLSQFASSLDNAIRSTAEDAGVLDDYTNAVEEYRKAMKLNALGKRLRSGASASSRTPYPERPQPTQSRARSEDRRRTPMSHHPRSAERPVKRTTTLDRRHQKARQAMPQKPVKPHSTLSENRVDEAMKKRKY